MEVENMADVQKYFVQFDEAIRFDREAEKKILADKRECILRKLSEGIKRQRVEGTKIPSYEPFNQGSYAMNIGVKPVDGDFDIDVGLRFDLSKEEYPDPVVVKTWVHNALKIPTNHVDVRRSCVTIFYQEGGEDKYHVDLAIYSSGKRNSDSKDYIAKGKPGQPADERRWEPSDPLELQNVIMSGRSEEDTQQFRRVIRALKRWKELRLSRNHGRAAPKGIALTVAAHHWFDASYKKDASGKPTKYDDLGALSSLVTRMLSKFEPVWNAEERRYVSRLRIEHPVSRTYDFCSNMSTASMLGFKEGLEKLLAVLKRAHDAVDPGAACKALREQFGEDFPVPEK
ncbi:cyclic GMP-AMP synthase DncV-like nucleotidyltransferase [Sorangium sp. So ce131]|uniref:cyclic GMP-AMP synthase DncV-like nucleotidyltransferase n=1 Tax=Sorangium sp. So ce131 TaxID=3133282 RepID=UPI003F600580